jgi:hypothetical protein
MSLDLITAEFLVSRFGDILNGDGQDLKYFVCPQTLKFSNAVSLFIKNLEG